MFHISVLMEEHSRDECATHSLASVRGQLDISLRTPSTEEAPEKLRRCRNSPVSAQEPRSSEQLTSIPVHRVPSGQVKCGGRSGQDAGSFSSYINDETSHTYNVGKEIKKIRYFLMALIV